MSIQSVALSPADAAALARGRYNSLRAVRMYGWNDEPTTLEALTAWLESRSNSTVAQSWLRLIRQIRGI